MTRRYFYTDPLAALWMVKHHGMEIVGHIPGNVLVVTDHTRLYVADESLHLLEPEEDDVVLMNDLEGANSVEFWSKGRNKGKLIRVVERRGIPFHWPHSEEAEGV